MHACMYVQEGVLDLPPPPLPIRSLHSLESITIHSPDFALICLSAKHKRQKKTFVKFPGPSEFACGLCGLCSRGEEAELSVLIDNGFIAAKPSALTIDEFPGSTRQRNVFGCFSVASSPVLQH